MSHRSSLECLEVVNTAHAGVLRLLTATTPRAARRVRTVHASMLPANACIVWNSQTFLVSTGYYPIIAILRDTTCETHQNSRAELALEYHIPTPSHRVPHNGLKGQQPFLRKIPRAASSFSVPARTSIHFCSDPGVIHAVEGHVYGTQASRLEA